MKLSPYLMCMGVLVGSVSFAAAKPAYVLTTVNLRAAPGTTNEIVTKIPGGSLVDAANCTDGWCAVTWQEKSGFAIQTSLDLSGRVPNRAPGPVSAAPSRSYTTAPPPGYVVDEGPVYYGGPVYYDYGPYYWRRPWRRW